MQNNGETCNECGLPGEPVPGQEDVYAWVPPTPPDHLLTNLSEVGARSAEGMFAASQSRVQLLAGIPPMDRPARPAANALRPAPVNVSHGEFIESMIRDAVSDAPGSTEVEYLPRLGAPWFEPIKAEPGLPQQVGADCDRPQVLGGLFPVRVAGYSIHTGEWSESETVSFAWWRLLTPGRVEYEWPYRPRPSRHAQALATLREAALHEARRKAIPAATLKALPDDTCAWDMTLKSDVTTNVEFTIPYYRTAVPDELLQQLMEDGLSNAEIGYLLLRQLFTEIVNSLDPEQWPHYLPDFNKHSKELRGAAQRLCPTRCTFSFWHIGTETPAVTLPDDGTREFVIERVSIRTTTDERDDPQHGPPPGHQFVRFYAIRIVAQVKYIAYYRAICEESLGREEGF